MKRELAQRFMRRVALVLAIALHLAGCRNQDRYTPLPYPSGKICALSIVDDMDFGSLPRLQPVYELLNRLGIQVTKTVWVLPAQDKARFGTIRYTLQSPSYRRFVKSLKTRGHEIALHGVSAGNDDRDRIRRGLEIFRQVIGEDPKMNTEHARNLENIYFGRNRLGGLAGFVYRLHDDTRYLGEDAKSDYFWGDLARDSIRYHRAWFFSDVNTLGVNPSMPYHDPRKPYVQYWHSVTDGFSGEVFLRRLSPKNIKRLKKEKGACILYTHFGVGFLDSNTRQPRREFVECMERIARDKEIWIVPASTLLDRLREARNVCVKNAADLEEELGGISWWEKLRCFYAWLWRSVEIRL